MNCKPGDLAIVVRLDSPNYGRTVVVERLHDGRAAENGRYYVRSEVSVDWIVRGHGLVIPNTGRKVSWHVVEDRYLRPIRDPGDDAQDQMLRPLPVEVVA